MTDRTLLVGPFNRVEGDLELRLDVEEGKVAAAYANSPMFRGFERMMLGKLPRDALTITPRICGICSISQSAAAARALADAAGQEPTEEGAKVAALLHAVENLADHVTHFTLFFMPDFARSAYTERPWHEDVVTRFTAQTGSSLRRAVEARAQLLHIVGLLGGKWPHTLAIQPGGVTRAPSARDLARIGASLRAFRRYLEETLFGGSVEAFAELATLGQLDSWDTGDVATFITISRDLSLDRMGQGSGRYMSFGAYPTGAGPLMPAGYWNDGSVKTVDTASITEDLSHAWMHGESAHPASGQTIPDEEMAEPAYSWCKAPRLAGKTVEVGALARQVVAQHPLALALTTEKGVRARVAGRLIEIAQTQLLLEELLASIDPNADFMEPTPIPKQGEGVGLVEAARGSLGHWIQIEDGRINGYQIIAPTTWNFSPRDEARIAGPVEDALVGAPVSDDEETPLSVQHIVRSFDPCMVCTVH